MRFSLALILSLFFSSTAIAENLSSFKQCGPQGQPRESLGLPPVGDNTSNRVHMFRNNQHLHADHVQYSDKESKSIATGNVVIYDDEYTMHAPLSAEYRTDNETAVGNDVTYWYAPSHGNGTADQARKVSEEIIELDNGTYSTCTFTARSWELRGKDVSINRKTGIVTGRNVTTRFKGVPVFYSPYMSFSLTGERKTGFVTPTWSRSSSSGFSVQTPWYWNIAPNRDALVTPRYFTKRGTELGLQTRYLDKHYAGQMNLRAIDDSEYNDGRYYLNLSHKQRFTQAWSTDLLFNKASDDTYFEDLGDTLGASSLQRLERRGDLNYNAQHFSGNWNGRLRYQDFQIVDKNHNSIDDPYTIRPQLQINNRFGLPGNLEFISRSEWTSFDHDSKVDGERSHFQMELSRTWASAAYSVKPAMRLMHTRYDLNNNLGDDTPDRSLPSFSLDAKALFERPLGGLAYRQTLEPRLFYLNTPKRSQDDIPVFDTGEHQFTFPQIFRTNRLPNVDRIADANQLTAALTSRLFAQDSGRELMRASIGQIFYFRDLEVTKDKNTAEVDENTSNVAAELSVTPSRSIRAVASAIYDTYEDQFDRSNLSLNYTSERNIILNLAHRYRRLDYSQSDLSVIVPISSEWRAVGRWNYDLKDEQDIDLLAGLEYDTCCWKIRVVGRRYTNDSEGDYNKSIEVQFTLKGLTTLGSPLGEQLQGSIRGYEDRNTYTD